ncbi:nucleotidyltransferase family protein [Listeria aquatica]|uniref:nucleotidyltransferase family protein n=1 Tax=Listeria aquatica TaxID=1494960 RepID=UPI0031F54850
MKNHLNLIDEISKLREESVLILIAKKGMSSMELETIKHWLLEDKDIGYILELTAHLNLNDCWVCAGTIRNFIWNCLSGKMVFDPNTDIDIVFFDTSISYEETILIEQQMKRDYPKYQWEVKNQVYMHIHNPHTSPYKSAKDAISKFPETCTAIAARLNNQGQLEMFCPYGLVDLLSFKVIPAPYFLEDAERMESYKNECAKRTGKKSGHN